eukprot:15355659-Ditylum_brightwellii.AAC.1
MHPLAVIGSFLACMAYATLGMGHGDVALFCAKPVIPMDFQNFVPVCLPWFNSGWHRKLCQDKVAVNKFEALSILSGSNARDSDRKSKVKCTSYKESDS